MVRLTRKTLAGEVADQSSRMSISGVQQKLLVDLWDDGKLLLPDIRGRYILKPQTRGYSQLPENEHLSMQLAKLAGLVVPPNGLVSIPQNGVAYVVKRFDRTAEAPPRKLRQEDFCSLSGRDPRDKYGGTAEECAEIVTKFSSETEASLRRLFLLFALSHWISNEDLHLKNLALLEDSTGRMKLSPAFDLVSTRLYANLRHTKALSLNGKKEQLDRQDFVAFGGHCNLSPSDAEFLLDELIARQPAATELVHNSRLRGDGKRQYSSWMNKKKKALAPP